jgi:aspartyl-tRNA(Asn)/glutamyl-tRNA(Gln) amidotransferase subunit A
MGEPALADDILSRSATDILSLYRSKQASPVEVLTATLDRIDRLDRFYNAFVMIDRQGALYDAQASERRWRRGEPIGLIDGLPVTVKDLVLVKGMPTRRGSRTTNPVPSEEDGPPVARMRQHGAVFLGKTTTSEFGWKAVTDSPLTGVTRNPWDVRLTSGGSSGGAGVAAALGMGILHLGTDGGGSIRVPASFCGVFGFKPTFGVTFVYPHSPALSLWHQGPLTRTVSDAVLMLTVMAGPDIRDWYAGPELNIDYRNGLSDGVRGLRIAYSRTLGYAKPAPNVVSLVDKAVEELVGLAAHVDEIDPDLDDPIEIMQPLWSVALALGVAPMSKDQRALLDPPLLELAEPGFRMSALEYRRLEQARENFGRQLGMLHAKYDLLVTPQLAIAAFAAGHEVPPDSKMKRWWEWSPFTYPFNLTQQPAASVPCGFTTSGLPVSIQIVGAKFSDALVLRAAYAYETTHPFAVPPVQPPPTAYNAQQAQNYSRELSEL